MTEIKKNGSTDVAEAEAERIERGTDKQCHYYIMPPVLERWTNKELLLKDVFSVSKLYQEVIY